MTWQRSGDTAADDPRVLAVLSQPEADGRLLNEVRGFIWALSLESAKYKTDYAVNLGVTVKCAGGDFERAKLLTDLCVRTGLLERVEINGLPGVKLIEDPDFIHLIKKAESDWDRQRKRDCSDPNLKWPVILRDGDHCRYCHHEVHWTGKMSNRKATLDHRIPGKPGTVDTLVVARATTARAVTTRTASGTRSTRSYLSRPAPITATGPASTWSSADYWQLTPRRGRTPTTLLGRWTPPALIKPARWSPPWERPRRRRSQRRRVRRGSRSATPAPQISVRPRVPRQRRRLLPPRCRPDSSPRRPDACAGDRHAIAPGPTRRRARHHHTHAVTVSSPGVHREFTGSSELTSNSVRTPSLRSTYSPGRDGTDSGRVREGTGQGRARVGAGAGPGADLGRIWAGTGALPCLGPAEGGNGDERMCMWLRGPWHARSGL